MACQATYLDFTKKSARYKCPANIDKELELKLKEYAKKAFRALELRDYARADVRLDKYNNPYFIEINTLPGLELGYSDFPKMAEKSGIKYDDLIWIKNEFINHIIRLTAIAVLCGLVKMYILKEHELTIK